MKLPNTPDSTSVFTLTYFFQQWAQIARVVNGGISFGSPSAPDNITGSWFTGTTPTGAGTEFTVPHTLGRIPTGWIMVSLDQPAVVYKGVTPWNSKTISLKCNIASINVILLVI